MKRTGTIWIATALLATGLVCGCGGNADKSSNATSQSTGHQAPSESSQSAAIGSSTPQQAVDAFLQALCAGDKESTEALLTTKARAETTAHDLVVQPPGAPSASYSVGRVQHVEGDEGSAYVSCVWSEEEGADEYEVVWILRHENNGWKIAGMATQVEGYDEPIVLNFEDLSELEDTMREAEMADTRADTSPADSSQTVR
jgi:hypothetical protein